MNLVSYVNLVINIPFLGGIICQPKIMLVSLTLCYSNLLTFSPNYHNFPQITQKIYIKMLEPGCVKQKLKKNCTSAALYPCDIKTVCSTHVTKHIWMYHKKAGSESCLSVVPCHGDWGLGPGYPDNLIQICRRRKKITMLLKTKYLIKNPFIQEKLNISTVKFKEPPQAFVPKILISWYPEWANCKGFLEPKSVNWTKS